MAEKRFALILFLFLFATYVLFTNGRFSTSMDMEIYRTVQNLVEHGAFGLDEKELSSRPGVDGKHYCVEGMLVMFLAVPFYLISKLVGVASGKLIVMMNQVFAALACVILFLVGQTLGYSRRTALWLAVIFGLGTMAFVHSKYMFPEPLTVIFFLSSLYVLLRFRQDGGDRWILLCGCFTGATILLRPDAFLFIFGMSVGMLYVLIKRHRTAEGIQWRPLISPLLLYGLPLIFFFTVFFYYNYVRFGSILETGYTLPDINQVVEIRYPARFFAIGETLKGLLGMWVMPNRSIFFINPILLLLFFSFRAFWRKDTFVFLLLGFIFLEYVYLYANRGPAGFPGSAAWGVRYMLPMTGFMVLPIGVVVERLFGQKRKRWKILFILLLSLSCLIQLIGSSVNYQTVQIPAERAFGATEARMKLTMDPTWSLLITNIQILLLYGPRDFLFLDYLKTGDIPLWACIALPMLVFSMLVLGFLLLTELFRSPMGEGDREEEAVKIGRKKHRKPKK